MLTFLGRLEFVQQEGIIEKIIIKMLKWKINVKNSVFLKYITAKLASISEIRIFAEQL